MERRRGQQPMMWELMSGVEAIMTRAFLWCGWLARQPVDYLLDPAMDMSRRDTRRAIRQHLPEVDFWWIGIECSSMCRARERPLPWPGAPGPLRSEQYPDGLPGLSERDSLRVLQDNSNADWCCDLASVATEAHGAAALLETPRRAYTWQRGMAEGLVTNFGFVDTDYDSCCFEGARCKRQRWRHSGDLWELHQLACECGHSHLPSEWEPHRSADGQVFYPTSEESAYTAGLAVRVAIAVSWWAVRTGRATLKLPRVPPPVCHGRRDEWLRLDPALLRHLALPVRALALGLEPPLPEQSLRAQIPSLVHAQSELAARGTSHVDQVIYIGPGHVSSKRSPSPWMWPFQPGPDGSRERCSMEYLGLLRGQWRRYLPELRGQQLWCDCQSPKSCHGFVIMAASYLCVMDGADALPAHSPEAEPRQTGVPHNQGGSLRRRSSRQQSSGPDPVETRQVSVLPEQSVSGRSLTRTPRRTHRGGGAVRRVVAATAVAASGGRGSALPASPYWGAVTLLRSQICWPQDAFQVAFRSVFHVPDEAVLTFPIVEDVLHGYPFDVFPSWLESEGMDAEHFWQPQQLHRNERRVSRLSLGKQERTFSMAGSLPPLLPFNLTPEEHYRKALLLAQEPTPLEASCPADADISFVADFMLEHRREMPRLREAASDAIVRLGNRLAPLTDQLRQWQPDSVKQVTKDLNLSLLLALVLVMGWPDVHMCYEMCYGFKVVGNIPNCHVYAQTHPPLVDEASILGSGWDAALQIKHRLRPSEADEFLTEATMKDVAAGFAEDPLPWHEFVRRHPPGTFRVLRRFQVLQASGKKRPCDDGDEGGHSALTADDNLLELCAATQPAVVVSQLHARAERRGIEPMLIPDSLSSGGDDWPDAYRYTPFDPVQRLMAVVIFWHAQWQTPALALYRGLLFGLSGAVVAFNRFSKFTQHMGRQLLFILLSMYFDDASYQDWTSCGQSAQYHLQRVLTALGRPFALAKRQEMSKEADFLGLQHSMERALEGVVEFWPRTSILTNLNRILVDAWLDNYLPPGMASKVYGMWNFLETGLWGHLGRAGLIHLRRRMYIDTPPFCINEGLAKMIRMFAALLSAEIKREYRVQPSVGPRLPRFLAASDAAADTPSRPTGGFLIHLLPGPGIAAVLDLNQEVASLLTPGEQKIAQWELIQVLAALVIYPDAFRGRQGLWFIDNVAALFSLVKGKSNVPDMDAMAMVVHALLFSLRCGMYFEYVQSPANWADEISRKGLAGPWHLRKGFCTARLSIPLEVLKLDLKTLLRVFSFL